jgi:hypothetical protein
LALNASPSSCPKSVEFQCVHLSTKQEEEEKEKEED